jgi:hypothetical protein
MELFHGERLKGRDNLKLRRLLVDHTPSTFDWLLSLGLVFYGPMPEPPHTRPRMHNILPNSRMLIHHLTKRARKLGVDIRTSAPMENLIIEQKRVTGVVVNGELLMAEKAGHPRRRRFFRQSRTKTALHAARGRSYWAIQRRQHR